MLPVRTCHSDPVRTCWSGHAADQGDMLPVRTCHTDPVRTCHAAGQDMPLVARLQHAVLTFNMTVSSIFGATPVDIETMATKI